MEAFTPATSVDETISRIRRCVWYSREAGNSLAVTFDMHALELRADPVFRYSPAAIDPVLLELLSAITYLFKSEDTTRLETVISQELR